jgi:soluble lytic murein transglycosylase-like protein
MNSITKFVSITFFAYLLQALLGISLLASGSIAIQDPAFSFIEDKLTQKLADVSAAEIRLAALTIYDGANKVGLDPLMVLAIVEQESQYSKNAIGPFGEIGLMQLRPTTAQWILAQYGLEWKGSKTLKEPVQNIKIGMMYLNWLGSQFKDARHIVSAYNMGAGNTRKLIGRNKVPRIYFEKVSARYKNLKQRFENFRHGCPPGNEILTAMNN